MLNTGIRTEGDFALSLLGEYTENKSISLKTSAFMGLALAYGGSHEENLLSACRRRYNNYGNIWSCLLGPGIHFCWN
jgi:hypothetical protein